MSEAILTKPGPPADERIMYGAAPSQFAELFLPAGDGPHPVVIAVHGGFWRARYDLSHLRHLCGALAGSGFAVWNLEYRRVGEADGGWPGTFDDVLMGADQLAKVAADHRLDLSRVIALGHSAGGHLALWLASQRRRQEGSRISIRGVVGLAAVSDLAFAAELNLSHGAVRELLGGGPKDVPDRYARASPAALLPLGVPQHLIHGVQDDVVPVELSRRYAERAGQAGDEVVLIAIDDAAHFEPIDPASSAWPAVASAVAALLDPRQG